MDTANFTLLIQFTFMGISEVEELRVFFFIFFLVIYLVTLLGNSVIILTICLNPQLHSPMYYFLCQLSFLDVCYSTATVPKMLAGLLKGSQSISYGGCVVQLYLFHIFGGTDGAILTIMAVDRYVAICNPLRYSVIMSKLLCCQLLFAAFLIATFHATIETALTFQLPFCGPYELEHYFCDVPPLLKVACADTSVDELVIMINIGGVTLISLLLILGSYIRIVATTVKMNSKEGKKKAFTTCTAHLTAVLIFFAPCIFTYLQPATTSSVHKMMAVFYTAIPPALNPIIYTLRNEEMKKAVKKLVFRKVFS